MLLDGCCWYFQYVGAEVGNKRIPYRGLGSEGNKFSCLLRTRPGSTNPSVSTALAWSISIFDRVLRVGTRLVLVVLARLEESGNEDVQKNYTNPWYFCQAQAVEIYELCSAVAQRGFKLWFSESKTLKITNNCHATASPSSEFNENNAFSRSANKTGCRMFLSGKCTRSTHPKPTTTKVV